MKMYYAILFCILIGGAGGELSAENFNLDSPRNRGLFRVEIDNDVVWNKDSSFSNGWSLQYHTVRYSNWDETRAPELIKWIGKNFPTLGDEDSIVRFGHGIGQNMITPGDLTNPDPPPGDLPYAGTLTYTFNWQSFNRQTARNFQITAGVLGRESLAEDFQRFMHVQIGFGEEPEGWHTQRDTEPIVNIAYQHIWQLAHVGTYTNDWAAHAVLWPSIHLGNIITGADLAAGVRIGWNMQEGFGSFPSPPGRGFFQAYCIPKPESASPHGFELIFTGCGTAIAYSVLFDGSMITGDDRDVDRNAFLFNGLVGLNYHYYDYIAVRVMFVKASDLMDEDSLPDPSPGRTKTGADTSYGAMMIDLHF